jgi:hypothetical protein
MGTTPLHRVMGAHMRGAHLKVRRNFSPYNIVQLFSHIQGQRAMLGRHDGPCHFLTSRPGLAG